MATFNIDDIITETRQSSKWFGKLGKVIRVDPPAIEIQYGSEKKLFHSAWLEIRLATPEEVRAAEQQNFFHEHPLGQQMGILLHKLQMAGVDGIENDCGHSKNQWFNYTCECFTLVKLYHRFSALVEALRKELDYNIHTEVIEGTKRCKTILKPGKWSESGVVFKSNEGEDAA